MSEEQIWIKNTDINSTKLYKLIDRVDDNSKFEYYSEYDNDSIENLVNLNYINLPSILNILDKRYINNNIYTYNGDILISINPFKEIDIYKYNKLPDTTIPHIYSIAEKAYQNIGYKNQSILVSGESGSGKTENTKYMLRYLCDNYAINKNLASKIINSNFLIELFGNAMTIRNANSSRFGKFIKLYLDNKNIVGANIENYLLEKSRISFANTHEKTYHIFYLLCKNRAKLEKFNIKTLTDYDLLKNSKYSKSIDEFENIEHLINVLNQFEFNETLQDSIFATLKIILELLNCSGKITLKTTLRNCSNEIIILGLDEEELFNKLTTKVYKVSDELIVKHLEDIDIIVNIKTFCEDSYEDIFNTIINKVSKSLGSKTDRYVGILDIFGFEVFDSNGYEQLCINYTNEMLQQIYNQYVFKSEQIEYEKEKLEWTNIEYVKNDSIINTFNGKLSLFSIINEQTILGSGNDANIYGQFEKHISGTHFAIDNLKRKDNVFSIKHFTGEVDYIVDNYVLKNRITSGDSKVKTNLQYFNYQLNFLKEELLTNNCQFIRCVKPNNKNIPDKFDDTKIYNQLLYSGIIEGVKIMLSGYPIKKNKKCINDEFRFVSYYSKHDSLVELLKSTEKNINKFQIGQSKIFMKPNFYRELDKQNNECRDKIVVNIQKLVRRFIAVRKYYFALYFIRLIQSKIRQYSATNRVDRLRRHIRSITINSCCRTFIYKRKYNQYKSATIISKHARRYIQNTKYVKVILNKKKIASIKILFWFRRHSITKKIINRKEINKLSLKLQYSHGELLKLKSELEETKNELKSKNNMLLTKDSEISTLTNEVSVLKKSVANFAGIDELNVVQEEMSVKRNMDTLILSNHHKHIDIIENYDPNQEIVNNTRQNDDETTLDIPIRSISMTELYNIPLSSDSDNDLCLNRDDIEYINNKKLEELGRKMELLYLELHNKKQIIEYMRSKHNMLERQYISEKMKKTNIWEVVNSYFSK